MEEKNEMESETDGLWECICMDGDAVKLDINLIVEYSGYFSGLMRSDMRETKQRKLNLCLFSADTVAFLIELFYHRASKQSLCELESTFEGHFTFDNIKEVLVLIDYLDIPCLYPKCCELLNRLISTYCSGIQRLWQMWNVSHTYNLDSVKDRLSSYLVTNIKQFLTVDELFLKELPFELLLGMLLDESLNVKSEEEVMSIIETWIRYNREERMQYFDVLFACVHVPSLIHSEFKEIETVVKKLDGRSVDMCQMYTNYVNNPHKYFADFPHKKIVRNGESVIISFGGVYEHSIRNYELNPTGPCNRYRLAMLPMFFTELSELCGEDAHFDDDFNETGVKRRRGKSRSPKICGKNEVDMKQFPSLKSPVRLVEFGTCIYDGLVYVFGGQRQMNDTAVYSVKGGLRLDPNCGEWQEVMCMRYGRCLFCLCAIWDRIYAVGGANQYHGILQSTEYYLPLEDAWRQGPDLPTPLHEHAGCVLNDNIYISGGHNGTEHTDKVWFLDSEHGPWKPVAPLLTPRSYHSMATVDGKLYVVGGCHLVENQIEDLFTVEEYDSSTDTWTQIMCLNVPVCDCLPIIMNQNIVLIGGYSFCEKVYLQQVVMVDTQSKKWEVFALAFHSKSKKIVGYACVNVKFKRRFLLS